jgi:16S rRNA (guanine(966)-N(2))-methyltransferase RsmD
MRINSGHFKGRVLQSVDGKGTRPTDSRAREMLFNVLGERVPEARVLDLYAGTGSIGIEALSRDAESCVFIEQNAGACRVIKANLKMLRVEGAAQVWQASVKSALRRLVADGVRFDIVFADPPFSNPRELGDLCRALDTAAALLDNKAGHNPASLPTPDHLPNPSADASTPAPAAAREETDEQEGDALPFEPMLVIQHHHKQSPTLSGPFRLWREKRAGESTLSFFVLDEEQTRGEQQVLEVPAVAPEPVES